MEKQRFFQKSSENQNGFSEIIPTIVRDNSIKIPSISGQPSGIINLQPGRRIVGHYHRKSMNLIQPKLKNNIDSSSRVKTLESPRKELLQHSLSYSGLHPAVQAGGILFQGNNLSNSVDHSFSINNSLSTNSLLNIDNSRQRVQQFLTQKDEKSLGSHLASKQIYQSHLPQRLKSLQVFNNPLIAETDGIKQQLQPGMSLRSVKNVKVNASVHVLSSSPRIRLAQQTQSQSQEINSSNNNSNPVQIPSNLQSLSFLQRSQNSSFLMSGNVSRIKGSGLAPSPQGGSSPKRSFYHHSDILSVKQFSNLNNSEKIDKISSDQTNENQRKVLIKQFRQKVDQYIRLSRLRKDQAAKEFNQFYDKIKDTFFQENSPKKSNYFSNNNLTYLANSVSFQNSNNDSLFENSNIFHQDSDVSLSGIQPMSEGNKNLMNLEASRFNYSKQSKEFPSLLDNINAEIYIEDQFGKQTCSTRPINQRQLQDVFLDKLKRLLTNEDTYTEKIERITEEYENVLKKIQTKSFKLKVPDYYEPLMQPFNDYYQIDLEKKRLYELRERDLDGQLLKQVLEEEGNVLKDDKDDQENKENANDDQVDEVQEIFEDEMIETEDQQKKQMQEGQMNLIESTSMELTQKKNEVKSKDKKIVGNQVVKIIKKKKKEKQHQNNQGNDEEEDGEDEDCDNSISRQKRPKQEGVSPNKGSIQKRRRVTRERTAIEEYLTYRPPSAKSKKKIDQVNLPMYLPPKIKEEPKRKQEEIVTEQEIVIENEELVVQRDLKDEQMIPVRTKSPRKKRDQTQQFVLSAGGSLKESSLERQQTLEDESEDDSNIQNDKNNVVQEEELESEFVQQDQKQEVFEDQSKVKEQETQKSENNQSGVKVIKLKKYKYNNNLPQTGMSDQYQQLQNIQLTQKKRIGTNLIDAFIEYEYLLNIEVEKYKIKKTSPEYPKDLEFENPEDRRLFDQLFLWQYEVDIDIQETDQYLHTVREKKNKQKNKKQHVDSDDDEDDPEREQMHMGRSGADNNSIHSSEITDFGPAAPFRESLNDIGSDIFNDLG